MTEKIENLDEYLEKFASIATLSKFDPFMQKIIEEDNIDYKTVNGLKELAAVRELAIVINYYGGAQFLIIKRNLEKKYKKDLDDDQVIHILDRIKPSFLDRYLSYNIEILSSYDRAEIYQNIRYLHLLKEKKAFNVENFSDLEEVLEYLDEFNFYFLANKYACISNAKQKIEFDRFGMQEYLNKIIPEIMNKEISSKILKK